MLPAYLGDEATEAYRALYKIFPKLGITNRTQLTHALQPHDRLEWDQVRSGTG